MPLCTAMRHALLTQSFRRRQHTPTAGRAPACERRSTVYATAPRSSCSGREHGEVPKLPSGANQQGRRTDPRDGRVSLRQTAESVRCLPNSRQPFGPTHPLRRAASVTLRINEGGRSKAPLLARGRYPGARWLSDAAGTGLNRAADMTPPRRTRRSTATASLRRPRTTVESSAVYLTDTPG